MEKEYGIQSSKGVYQRLFTKWGFRKNKPSENWTWVNHRVEKRNKLGKKRDLLIGSSVCETKKIQKEISRHVTTLNKVKVDAATPATPEGFVIITSAASESLPQTQDTPDEFSPAAPHEDVLKDQALIASIMKDCGSFILLWAAMGLSMSRGSMIKSYSIVAERIITDTWDLTSHPATQRLLAVAAFEILYSTYFNDLARLNRQLPFLPADLVPDIIRTAMFISSAKGCVDAARILFSAEVDVDSRDKKGQTCLHNAAIHNKIDMVSFLISRNANVNQKRKDGQTVWTLVCCSEEHEIISHLLIEAGANKHVLINCENPIYSSAAGGNVNVVRLLLIHPFKQNFSGSHCIGPLQTATSKSSRY